MDGNPEQQLRNAATQALTTMLGSFQVSGTNHIHHGARHVRYCLQLPEEDWVMLPGEIAQSCGTAMQSRSQGQEVNCPGKFMSDIISHNKQMRDLELHTCLSAKMAESETGLITKVHKRQEEGL